MLLLLLLLQLLLLLLLLVMVLLTTVDCGTSTRIATIPTVTSGLLRRRPLPAEVDRRKSRMRRSNAWTTEGTGIVFASRRKPAANVIVSMTAAREGRVKGIRTTDGLCHVNAAAQRITAAIGDKMAAGNARRVGIPIRASLTPFAIRNTRTGCREGTPTTYRRHCRHRHRYLCRHQRRPIDTTVVYPVAATGQQMSP